MLTRRSSGASGHQKPTRMALFRNLRDVIYIDIQHLNYYPGIVIVVIANHAHSTTLPPLREPETRVIRWSKGKIKGNGEEQGQTQSPMSRPDGSYEAILSVPLSGAIP